MTSVSANLKLLYPPQVKRDVRSKKEVCKWEKLHLTMASELQLHHFLCTAPLPEGEQSLKGEPTLT